MFRLPFSLLFLTLLNLAAASTVKYWKSREGYWYYQGEVQASNVDELQNIVAQAYNDMVADVEKVNQASNRAYKTPSMMTGIFDGSSVILGSSVQGYTGNVQDVPADFPQDLKDIMAEVAPGQCHRHAGLCAEPMALATYVVLKGKLPDSTTSKVATYGQPPQPPAGPQNPCSADNRGYGCKDLLDHLALSYYPKLVAGRASSNSKTPSQPIPQGGQGAGSSSKTPSQPKPPVVKQRRAIADEIHSLLLRVRDLQTFDNFLAKRGILIVE